MQATNHYKAKEVYTYKRKIDGCIMGNELYLGLFIDGTKDTINNYEEVKDPDYNQKDFFSFWCESKYISEIMYDLTMLAYIKEVMLTEAKGKLNNTLDESYYKDMTKKYQLYITAGNKLNNKFNEISENTIKKFVIKEMNIDENEYRELNQIVDEYVNSPDSIKSSVFKEIEKLLGKEDDKK